MPNGAFLNCAMGAILHRYATGPAAIYCTLQLQRVSELLDLHFFQWFTHCSLSFKFTKHISSKPYCSPLILRWQHTVLELGRRFGIMATQTQLTGAFWS